MESVRTIWRLRDRHVKDASRAVRHMQKALTKMNIQGGGTAGTRGYHSRSYPRRPTKPSQHLTIARQL
jgi:hypothetical protein